MPSPAQDSVSTVVHTGKCVERVSWHPPGHTYTYILPWVQSSQALVCPATVVNPLVNGVRAMSPWSKQWHRAHAAPVSWKVTQYPGRGSTTTYDFNSVVPIANVGSKAAHYGQYWLDINKWWPKTPWLEFSADAEARTKVLNKLSLKKWDVGVAAVELRQTAGLVTDLATGMVRTVESVINSRHNSRKQVDDFFRSVQRHGSFDKAVASAGKGDVKVLNQMKDSWMQYQFGVRPLLKDIDDATTYLADKLAQGVPFTVKAKAGAEREDTYMGRNMSGDGLNLMRIRPRITETCSVHYSVLYEMPTGQVPELTTLGLDNPWSVAWEVTRLSWMFDYAVGVGDWLQSFTAANGLIFRQGCRSRLRKLTVSEWVVEPGNALGTIIIDKRPNLSRVHVDHGDFRRELLASRLVPAVMPSIKSTLGLTQLGNSLFALSNVFAGKRGLR